MAKSDVETEDETEPETSQEDVETGMEQNVGTDEDYGSPSVLNEAIRLRVDEGLSFRQISKRLGLSLSMIGRLLKGVRMKGDSTQLDADNGEPTALSPSSLGSHTPSLERSSHQQGTLVPTHLWDQLDNTDKKSLQGWKTNVNEWNRLQGEKLERNNGHGNAFTSIRHDNGDDEVNHQIAEILKIKKMKMLLEDDKPNSTENPYQKILLELLTKTLLNQKGEQSSLKDTLEIAKFVGGSSQKESLALVSYILQAKQEGQNVTLNDIALKLEELKETHDVEMAKLGFETEKWRYTKDHEGDTLKTVKELIKDVSEGPVGKAIENMGGGAADRIRGGPKIPMINVQCPNCSNKFRVNPSLLVVQCPSCGNTLQKQEPQPATQQTPTETEPQQPQQPRTEKETVPMNLPTGPGETDF